MKKLIFLFASVVLSLAVLSGGCLFDGSAGRDGRDGKDGQNVTIDDIYNKYASEHDGATFEEFLKEYLSYSGGEINAAASLQKAINRSMTSGVTVLTRFSYTRASQGIFGQTQKKEYKVYTGSGAILWKNDDGDAYVVTNCHVIYDDSSDTSYCDDIRLYLYGQDTPDVNYLVNNGSGDITNDENYRMSAEIVGASVNYDLALLKISGSEVLKRSDCVAVSDKTTIAEALNDSFVQDGEAYVGETVYAVGNASGEGMSASQGIVSKDSEIIDVGLSDVNADAVNQYRVLRTTAPINHGNSGGALYNASGKIVGVVNAKDEEAGIDNMGYALPANTVRRLVVSMYESYVANGNKPISSGKTKCGIKKAFLNIQTVVSDSYSRYENGVVKITELIRVEKVDGRPANGKIEVNDILVSAKLTSSLGVIKENVKINRNYVLSEMLISARAGDTLTLTVERNNSTVEISISLDSSCFKYFE